MPSLGEMNEEMRGFLVGMLQGGFPQDSGHQGACSVQPRSRETFVVLGGTRADHWAFPFLWDPHGTRHHVKGSESLGVAELTYLISPSISHTHLIMEV